MKEKYVHAYMDFAHRVAQLSHGVRLKVGAVIVKDDIVVYGYNGMPSGWDNTCEHKRYMDPGAGGWLEPEEIETQWPHRDEQGRYALVTNPEVLHAEMNAISKIAKSTIAANGADMFITHSPCIECSKGILQAGIKNVFYSTAYRDSAGVDFLHKSKINVVQLDTVHKSVL